MPAQPLGDVLAAFAEAREETPPQLRVREIGTVTSVDGGIVQLHGLPEVTNEEVVEFATGALGFVVELQPGRVSIAMLDGEETVQPGTVAWRTHRVLSTPVGEALVGRVVDPLGRPLDGRGPLTTHLARPVERPAPPITVRAPIKRPLHTGIMAIDSMIPIGRGQRELIVGDRATGKTAITVDTILHQRGGDVLCVYCAIGQPNSSVARVIDRLRSGGALGYTTVVVAKSEDLPGLRFVTPYTAMTIAEYLAESGRDVLIVFDDLTQHAQSYRELSLLLRRPPGREAFPGDIFYVHSRLLERSTQWRQEFGGGSLTAMPVVETEAQDIAAYIPTNVVSITDGQVYLSPDLFQKGMLPAVDVGRSVSRVGGKAQLPTYRLVSGKLKLAYSQYEELEHFSRFGTRMDEETRDALEHGRRVRELLKQPQYETLGPARQIFMLFALTERMFDGLSPAKAAEVAKRVADRAIDRRPDLARRIEVGEKLDPETLDELRDLLAGLTQELR